MDSLEILDAIGKANNAARMQYVRFQQLLETARKLAYHDGINSVPMSKWEQERLNTLRKEICMYRDMVNAADEVVDRWDDNIVDE
jgi:hypothetical protein